MSSYVTLAAPEAGRPETKSYGQIFKSTALTGASAAFQIGLGILRAKLMAILVGPSGVGLMGMYTTIATLASTIAGMGVASSGVRQIAGAAASGDATRIAKTIQALRLTAPALGLAGGVLLAVLCKPVSRLAFGTTDQAMSVALLGIMVFIGSISTGQTALLQGLRRISDLARSNVIGAFAGTMLALPVIWIWRDQGIVAMMILLAGTGVAASWWFARQVEVPNIHFHRVESTKEVRSLLRLGMSFMASALLAAIAAFLTRLMIVRELGIEAAGHYTAAYALSGIYAGFILRAMGSDFFPRLTAASGDHPTVNRLVNEQTEIALLIAIPGILFTLTLAPWVIPGFYAKSFGPAVEILQWQVFGILGQVISWPLGYVLMAKGRHAAFFWTELAAHSVHVALIAAGIQGFGLAGAGMAFAGLYVFYIALMVCVTRRLTGFHWSKPNLTLMGWMLPLVTAVFIAMARLPRSWSLPFCLLASGAAGWVCLNEVLARMPEHRLNKRLRRFMRRTGE